MGRAWLVELTSKPPSAVGVTCGSERSGERWSIPALVAYAREHGPGMGKLGADALRDVLETSDKVLRRTAIKRADKPEPPNRLSAESKGVLTKRLNGVQTRGDNETLPVPVTLPTCFFSSRPEIPPTDRERLGAEFNAPVPVTRSERRQSEDEILKEAEAAARDLKGFAPMPKWIMIGKGLLILRRRAMEDSGAKRPIGIGYSVKFGSLIRQHGFGWITRTTRWAIMCIVKNLKSRRQCAEYQAPGARSRRAAMCHRSRRFAWNARENFPMS
jgi:hypothetical protein